MAEIEEAARRISVSTKSIKSSYQEEETITERDMTAYWKLARLNYLCICMAVAESTVGALQ